jgi:hypothetical protein
MLPPGAVVRIAGSSPKWIVYMDEPLPNRIVYVAEAAALLDSNRHEKEFAGMLRVLIPRGGSTTTRLHFRKNAKPSGEGPFGGPASRATIR